MPRRRVSVNRRRARRLSIELAPYERADFVPLDAFARAGVLDCELATLIACDMVDLHEQGISSADLDLCVAWLTRDWQWLDWYEKDARAHEKRLREIKREES